MPDYASDFDFIEDESGGKFVPVGGPVIQLRQLLVRGEVDTAVGVYEETAGTARESLLEEAKSASFETRKATALMFRKARDFVAAGRVFSMARLEVDAGQSFEQGNDFAAAAASYKRAGELLKAAACFERAGNGAEAIELYRQAGANEQLAESLARQKRYDEAAIVFRSLHNDHAEVEVLRNAVELHQGGVATVVRLAELMIQYGHAMKAAQLLLDTARTVKEAQADPAFLELLASSLELTQNTKAAVKVREKRASMGTVKVNITVSNPAATAPPQPKNAGPDGYGFLKALPMFAELTLPDMKALYRICTEAAFAPGQHLIEIGQPGKGLFVIVDGMVEVYGGPDASSRLLNTMGAGAYVGEISLVRDTPTSARVTARTQVKALTISTDAFTKYLYNNSAAALCIYRLFTENLAERVRALSAAR